MMDFYPFEPGRPKPCYTKTPDEPARAEARKAAHYGRLCTVSPDEVWLAVNPGFGCNFPGFKDKDFVSKTRKTFSSQHILSGF